MDDILTVNEDIYNELTDGAITGKQAEQKQQCLKTTMRLADMEMRYVRMRIEYRAKGKASAMVVVPRMPLNRSIAGLPDHVSPQDADQIRGELT